jgi:phage minor structural protein, N-terminal domain protein|nr:MAG TPA: Neck appendage protein [Caudoviricetes sp.]
MPLNAAYADEIVQEDNSTYQLSFRFPTSDPLWEKLKEETFLTADDLHGEQDFVIFEVEKKHGYIQVYANQVFTLLNNYVVNPISLDRQTGSTALSRFAGSITRDNPFSFFSDIEDRHTFNIGSKNAMEAFAKDKHSIIGQWGGDLVRHGYQVRLLKKGGSENESLFMYKKNLSSYQHKTSTKSLKTRITFKTTVKGEGEKAPDRTFTVTIDSPLINKYSQIYEDVIEVNDQDVKDEASLRKYGEQYYRTSLCDMMEDSLEIEVVGQSDVPVQMFDVVSIFHEHYNLDVRKKITKYTYSPMGKKLKTIGFGQFQSGLANAIGNAVSDAVKGEAQQLQSDFERQLARELKNADLAFDRKTEELKNEFEDGLNATRAKAEEVKRELSDTIDQRFNSFNNGPLQEAKRRAEEALRNAGASSLLAQEAKRISLDSITKLEELKRQTTSAQTALSGDLDVLKRTVANEVNQASEYRRTTTEALSRMTGQMNGFATKSEVAQGIDGLTQTFAKMRVGGRNLLRGSKGPFLPDRKPANFDNNILYVGNTSIYMEQGQEYIISAKTDGNFTAHHDGLKESDNVVLWIMDKDVRNYQIVSDLKTGTTGTKIIWNKPTGIYHLRVNTYHKEATKSVWDVKIEKGTIATDWSPAIEDVETQITEARTEFKQTADGLSTKMAAVETYVGQDNQRQESLRRYTREESARQATTVRELVARDYVGKSTHQEDVRGIEHRLEAITNPQNGSIATQIAKYKTAVDGRFADMTSMISGKANQTDFQRVRETSQLYERILGNTENGITDKVARMALTSQLFQIEVAKNASNGQNLLKGTKSFSGDWENMAAGWKKHPDKYQGCDVLFKNNSWNGIGQEFDAKIGEIYTFSLWMKSDWKNDTVYLFVNRNGSVEKGWGVPSETSVAITSEWKRYSFTFKITANGFIFPRIERPNQNTNLYVAGLKLEKGSYATPYTQAPEDTDEAIRTVQSQLAGSWAVQNLTSAGSIVSQINATNNQILIEAEKIRLKGKTLLDELTAIQGYFKRLFVGDASVGTLNSDIIRSNSITADKLVMDMAMARRFVSSDIFTDTLAAKEAFINKLRSVVVTATLLEGYKGRIGGFQIGTHEKDSSVYWITGQNQFSVGMSNGSGHWSQTALWVNWGNNWGSPGNSAWFVKNNGKMYCYNQAEFWNTPIVHGNLEVTGDIFFRLPSGRIGYWTSSGSFKRFEENAGYIYFYRYDNSYSWIPINKDISDRRYKSNIQDSQVSALDVIENLKTYSYRKEYDDKVEDISCGIMAQDVQKYVPEAFYENPDGAYSYRTFELVPYLIKAIQELNQKIQKLEKTA